jgi:hypothetical protein
MIYSVVGLESGLASGLEGMTRGLDTKELGLGTPGFGNLGQVLYESTT